MKTRLFYSAMTALVLAFFSCSSDDSGDDTNPIEEPIAETGGFKWKENGGSFIEADSAFFASQWNTIKVYKEDRFIEINLTASITGTYPIGTSNALSMLVNNDVYIAGAGSLVVSENASGKMSGTFTSTGTGAGITALEGVFDDIEVR